jgi:hypothetical protein
MSTIRRRPKSAKPLRPNHPPAPPPKPPAPSPQTPPSPPLAPARGARGEGPAARPSPVARLEERLAEPDEGAFLHGLENRVYYPTLIEKITVAGHRIVEVLHEHDSPELFAHYEELEFEVSWVRERAAFSMGWQHGSADGRAEVFRRNTPGLREPAQQLADRARALVVNEGLNVNEATALLLETAWAIVLSRPAPVPGA